MRSGFLALLVAALGVALLPASPLSGQARPLVVLDPGHGGEEPGVVVGDLVEKDVILRAALAIGAEFVAAGYDVAFTRTRDVSVAWDDRRGLADESGAAALFMLHAMQSEDPGVAGAEIYVDEGTPASVALAEAVAGELGALGSPVVVDPRPWPFLQSPRVPTVMIEAVHLTNPGDLERMLDPAFHHELGRALVRALKRTGG